MSKIVLVGANHAGTACINTILDNYKGHEVVVFDRNSNISFLGCGMALWIGKQMQGGGQSLFYSNADILSQKGAKIKMNTAIDRIDFKAKEVHYTEGGQAKVESYDKLVLATGSEPILPPIPGMDLENVQLVKLYQHAEVVIEKLQKAEFNHITVVGAGYIGVELAEAFIRLNKKVALVDVADSCLGNYYDAPFRDQMTENLKKNGIDTHFGTKVEAILGDKKVEAVKTNHGEIKTDMVIMCVGFRANTALGKEDLALFRNGAYLVNKRQQTSVEDVYAIGDCATVFDNAIGKENYIALATNAVRSGIVAAHNVCGTAIESVGVQGSNGISIFGLNMISTGLSVQSAALHGIEVDYSDFEDNQRPEFMLENDKVSIRIVFEKSTRRIVGMQAASRHDISLLNHMFSLAIQEKVTIDKLALTDIFFLPHFNKPYNYITMAAITAKK